MRPCGDLRVTLRRTVAKFEQQGVTCRGLAQGLGMDATAIRFTVENMVASGELVVVGHCREPGSFRPVNLYALPGHQMPLESLICTWARQAA
jgi:predicted ArsR family transcriptional regulator